MSSRGPGAKLLAEVVAWVRRAPIRFREFYDAHRPVLLVLGLILGSAFLTRYLAILRYPAPPGADYGNYLTNLHAMLGEDVTGGGVQYPGVFMMYLWLVILPFGELPGLELSGPLLGALLVIPGYIFLRSFVDRPFALLGSALLTFSEGVSEMIGWGGNPNLLGMFFGTFFCAYLIRYMQTGTRRNLLAAGLSMAGVAGSHQVSIAFFAFTALLAIAVYAVTARMRVGVSRVGIALGVGAALSIPFAPFYWLFVESSSEFLPSRQVFLTVEDATFLITWLFRESLALWIPISIAGILGYRKMRLENINGFSVGVALLLSPFILGATIMALHPVRPFYFLYLGLLPGAMFFLERAVNDSGSRGGFRQSRVDPTTVMTAVVLALSLVLVTTAHRRMSQAVDWYHVMGEDVLDSLRWIREFTPVGSVVATSGPNRYGAESLVGCTWGWWIEGLAHRKSLCTADPPALAWRSQATDAADANRAFAGGLTFENGWIRVGEFAPYGSRGNPIVYADFGLGYESFVYFNDARVVVQWQPDSNPVTRTDTAFFLANTSAGMALDGPKGSIVYSASAEGLAIQRSVELSSDSGRTWVNYSVMAAGILRQMSVSTFGTSTSRLNNFDFSTLSLSIGGVPGFREKVGGSVHIAQGGNALNETTFLTNPEAETPEATFIFAPGGPSFNLSFAVDASYDRSSPPSGLLSFRAHEIMQAHSVDFLLIDKHRVREMEWISNDRDHFQITYQNFGVALFRVLP